MKTYRILAGNLCSLMLARATRAAPVTSHFPATGLGGFLAEHFDLASIRSSLGPRRTTATRTFADLGMKPSQAGDGIEDLKACFVDRAVGGPTYSAMKGLLITRYAPHGYALALRFDVADACAKPGYLSGPALR